MGVEPTPRPEPPLVFVYLGREIPNYTHASLRFAAKGHSGKTVLLTNSSHQLSGDSAYEVEDFQSWYDPSHFHSFRENTTLDPHFRGGFWLHVVERFFVLRQYMERHKLDGLFHAELDVMVFDLFGVAEACNAHGSGIFAVPDSSSRALASLFYVNLGKKFDHFLSFALSQTDMRNEMDMIGSYLTAFPENGHALPSHAVLNEDEYRLTPSALASDFGLFDANGFGQWLFGVDPKNVRLTVRNHYRNPTVLFPVHRARFNIPLFGRSLTVRIPGGTAFRLRTLHVHSKIVPRLTLRPVLIFYLWVNNLPVRWIVLRKKGWLETRLLELILRGRAVTVVRALHKTAPRTVETALLKTVARAAVPLSTRQRTLLLSLLQGRNKPSPSGTRLPTVLVNDEPSNQGAKSSRQSGTEVEAEVNGGGVTLEEALCRLLESADQAVVARHSEGKDLQPLVISGSSTQPLVVTAHKFDSHWPIVTSRWGDKLDTSLSFSPSAQIIRPDWLREMFPGGVRDVRSWLSSNHAVSWGVFVQAYGAWARTHHPKSVVLVPENAGSE